jgi:hypothetical protein
MGDIGMVGVRQIEGIAEVVPHLLQIAFDGPFRAPQASGDFGHLESLDAQLQDLALGRRELLQALGDGQLQDREVGVLVEVGDLDVRLRLSVDGAPEVPLPRPLVRLLSPDAIQRDDQEQSPQLLAGRDVVIALADAAKEAAENRLHEVFRLDVPLHLDGTPGADEGAQALGVPEVQLGRGVFVAAAEVAKQGSVGRLAFGRRGHRFVQRSHGGLACKEER